MTTSLLTGVIVLAATWLPQEASELPSPQEDPPATTEEPDPHALGAGDVAQIASALIASAALGFLALQTMALRKQTELFTQQTEVFTNQTRVLAKQTLSAVESLRIGSYLAVKQSLAHVNEMIIENGELAVEVGDDSRKAIKDLLLNHYALIFQLHEKQQLDDDLFAVETHTLREYARQHPRFRATVASAIAQGYHTPAFVAYLKQIVDEAQATPDERGAGEAT